MEGGREGGMVLFVKFVDYCVGVGRSWGMVVEMVIDQLWVAFQDTNQPRRRCHRRHRLFRSLTL